MKHLLALIGGQPLPNLLPAFFIKPIDTLLVYTDKTEKIYKGLEDLMSEQGIKVYGISVDAYDIPYTKSALEKYLQTIGWNDDIGFNLTGGTKAMVLATNELAQKQRATVLYLESESGKNRLYEYHYELNGALEYSKVDEISQVISIKQFLNAQLGRGKWQATGYSKDIGGEFERAIGEALIASGIAILPGVKFLGDNEGKRPQADLDMVIQIDNQFGVIEAKDRKKGNGSLDAIKQLNYLSSLLGTYTAKFSVLSGTANSEHQAVVEQTNTKVIELTSFKQGTISSADKDKLIQTVTKKLRG